MTAEELIEILGLEPHPAEGGHFVETYRSRLSLPPDVLPAPYTGERDLSTAIYYLLTPTAYSAMHRVPGDEVFHFYLGDPVEMLVLHPDGSGERAVLGTDLAAGMRPQRVVPGGAWQGARLLAGAGGGGGGFGGYGLLGTTMAPGFDYDDFELGARSDLLARYPEFREGITALTAGG